MNRSARKSLALGAPAPTVTHKVRFGKEVQPNKPHADEKPTGHVPRVARLLALAHRIDGMIRSGQLKDWAEAARLIGVTRARMTQIAYLLLLSPRLQQIVSSPSPVIQPKSRLSEKDLRLLVASVDWHIQELYWGQISSSIRASNTTSAPLRVSKAEQQHLGPFGSYYF